MTRVRVELFTTATLLSTRDTVAVETFAFLATSSRFMRRLLVLLAGWASQCASRKYRTSRPRGKLKTAWRASDYTYTSAKVIICEALLVDRQIQSLAKLPLTSTLNGFAEPEFVLAPLRITSVLKTELAPDA